MKDADHLEDLIKIIESAVALLPDTSAKSIGNELYTLKDLIMNARPPKIMIVGRRGAGKSSLINAIFGEPVAEVGSVTSATPYGQWYNYKSARGSLEILDTRGVGDRHVPNASHFRTALEELKATLKTAYPDALLFLVKAKEVDSHIQEDMRYIKNIFEFVNTTHKYPLPVLASVTQVDELDPVDVSNPPYEDPEKQDNIRQAVQALSDAFQDSDISVLKIIPTSAYARFRDGERLNDRYWNIETLVTYLTEALPKNAQLELARITQLREVQRRIARILIASSATVCAGIAATPLPVADLIPITSAQVAMITGVAYTAGRELSTESALEFLAALGLNVGVGLVVRELTRALIKFVLPGGGSLVSSGIAFGATWGIGEAAIAYFIDGLSIEEAQNRYQSQSSKKTEEYENK